MENDFDIFLVLGLPGSGRMDCVHDILDGYYPKDQKISVLIDESDHWELKPQDNLELIQYRLDGGKLLFPSGIPQSNKIFILNPSTGYIVDFLETVQHWCRNKKLLVSRVITMAHMQKIIANEKIARWYHVLIHFSDVVFLNHRNDIKDKEIRAFTEKYNKKESLPCLFDFVKKGRIKNPALAVEGSPRRISQAFDEEEYHFEFGDVLITDENDQIIEDETEITSEFQNAPEPYFERLPGGRRKIDVPKTESL